MATKFHMNRNARQPLGAGKLSRNCIYILNLQSSFKALDKMEYLVIIRDNFCQFCIKTYVVTPHLNDETVQMRCVTTYSFNEEYE